jgi:hypothetical protein
MKIHIGGPVSSIEVWQLLSGGPVELVGSKIFGPGPASLFTLLIFQETFLMFRSSSRSANTNFFYSVYPYRWLAYLAHTSAHVSGHFHNNRIIIEFYLS